MIEMNDCVVEREMQDARDASHFIRGAILRFSSKGMVHCNSTFRARQISNVYDATQAKGVAQNSKLTKRGLMRFWVVDFVQDTNSVLQLCVICR